MFNTNVKDKNATGSWRGMLTESKSFMNYPKCGRWYFWRRFPMAAMRYYSYTFKDFIDRKYYELKENK